MAAIVLAFEKYPAEKQKGDNFNLNKLSGNLLRICCKMKASACQRSGNIALPKR
jgi:hypothetical protein